MKKLLVVCTAAFLALFLSVPGAGAQSPELSAEPASVAELGPAEFDVTGSGFTAGLDLFVLPCVAPDGDITAIDGQVDCEIDDLTAVTADADGGFVVTVGPYEVVDNFAIVAGDQANTESAGVLITVDGATTTTTTAAPTTTTTTAAPTTTTADDTTDTTDGELPETGAGTDLLIGGALAIAAAGVLAARGGQLLGRR